MTLTVPLSPGHIESDDGVTKEKVTGAEVTPTALTDTKYDCGIRPGGSVNSVV